MPIAKHKHIIPTLLKSWTCLSTFSPQAPKINVKKQLEALLRLYSAAAGLCSYQTLAPPNCQTLGTDTRSHFRPLTKLWSLFNNWHQQDLDKPLHATKAAACSAPTRSYRELCKAPLLQHSAPHRVASWWHCSYWFHVLSSSRGGQRI